ncbi:MAG: fimbrillin family protein [Muribaculaceae bacterium]|nr:fimbrillin family protein [Muribaculaceae bacterium]
MKQNFIMAAALACLCASCANDSVIEENRASDEIKFRVFAEGNTRADKVYCPSEKVDAFKVFATDAVGNLIIDGDEIELQGTTYVNTSATRYWPESGKLTFEALLNGDKDADGKVPFTVAATAAAQKDLIYAKAEGQKSDGQVTLNFRHALSQVVFNAKNTNETLTVVVKSVQVGGVNNTGSYTLPEGFTTGQITEDANHNGDEYVTTGRGSWGDTSGYEAYTVTPSAAITVGANATAISGANSKDALMLIPGEYTKWAANGKLSEATTGSYFVVDATITQKVNDSETAATIWDGSIAIPADFKWEEGKRYVYTFNFGNGNGGVDPEDPTKPVFVPITFDVTVDEFVPANSEIEAGGAK